VEGDRAYSSRTVGHNSIVDNANVAAVSGLDIVIAGIEWAGHDENNA